MMQGTAYRAGKTVLQILCQEPCLSSEKTVVEHPEILRRLLRFPVPVHKLSLSIAEAFVCFQILPVCLGQRIERSFFLLKFLL